MHPRILIPRLVTGFQSQKAGLWRVICARCRDRRKDSSGGLRVEWWIGVLGFKQLRVVCEKIRKTSQNELTGGGAGN